VDTSLPSAVVSFEDVRAAAQRLRGVAHRTPILTSRTLDKRSGCEVFLKAENFQRMGAFKFRGAYNRMAQMGHQSRSGGVVAFSSGNHAQGVALAGKLLGIATTIVMPADAPASKIAATKAYGAHIVTYDRHRSHREQIARAVCEEQGATLVPPFDDPAIVAGAGTAALKLFEDVGNADALVAPIGGGGLLSGCALGASELAPRCAIYGVEPETGNDVQQSLERGSIVEIAVPKTIADGLQTTAPGKITFPILQRHVREVVTVSDDELRGAMRFAFERMKIVVEPSGAAGLAAVLFRKLPLEGKRVAVVISGGNVDAERFACLLSP